MGSAAGGGAVGRPPPQILGKIWIFLIFVMINLTFCRFRPLPQPPQILGSSGLHDWKALTEALGDHCLSNLEQTGLHKT